METRDLPADGKITLPGIYDIPIEVYHSQCCAGPSISSSGLRKILRSPAEFWMTSDLNPNRVEDKTTNALSVGRAAHHLLLGQSNFFKSFAIQPETYSDAKTGEEKKWTYAAGVCKDWRAEQEEAGLEIISHADMEVIKGLAGILPWQADTPDCGLKNSDLVMKNGILSGAVEQSLIWKEGKTWLKSRPDTIPTDSNEVTDLKTTESVDDRDLSWGLLTYGYYIQGALAGMGMSRVLNRQMSGFHLVYVSKKPPHDVSVRSLVEEDIILGEELIRMGLRIFERCLETKLWPGSTSGEHDSQKLSLPQEGRDRLKRRIDRHHKEFAL